MFVCFNCPVYPCYYVNLIGNHAFRFGCYSLLFCFFTLFTFLYFLQLKIWVWPQRLRTMHLLGYDDIFTTNTSLTRVRAVPVYSFSINTVEELNYVCPTIGIMPSGLPWIKKSHQKNELQTGSFLTSRYKRGKLSANTETQIDKQIVKTGSPEKIHKYIYTKYWVLFSIALNLKANFFP